MRIRKFRDYHETNIHYKVVDTIDNHSSFDFDDLKTAVKTVIENEKRGIDTLIIIKVTEEPVNEKTLNNIRIKLDSEKYNL